MSGREARVAFVGVVLFALAILGGCASGTSDSSTATPAPATAPTPATGTATGARTTPTGVGIRGQAPVDSLEIKMTGAPPPVKVQVTARGNLPDSCTKITDISQKLEGNNFTVTLGTFKAPNVMCIQVLTAYIQPVDLNVAGLKAGTYTVNVDGAMKQFTLQSDN
jgi:hypothetical protein